MGRRRLYKYFDSVHWAEEFVWTGSMRFSTLASFRDHQDAGVRGDANEGTAILRPSGGLKIHNHTQGRDMMVDAAEFQAKCGEIFVYCASNSQSDEKRDRFGAVACVEILDRKAFLQRAQKKLPPGAALGGRPGHERLGRDVRYHDLTDDINPRWAIPDLIGLSKLKSYAWQDEFRLMPRWTDALLFQNIKGHLVIGETPERLANSDEHHVRIIKIGSIADLAVLHPFAAPATTPTFVGASSS
jgi:hypothetical protein